MYLHAQPFLADITCGKAHHRAHLRRPGVAVGIGKYPVVHTDCDEPLHQRAHIGRTARRAHRSAERVDQVSAELRARAFGSVAHPFQLGERLFDAAACVQAGETVMHCQQEPGGMRAGIDSALDPGEVGHAAFQADAGRAAHTGEHLRRVGDARHELWIYEGGYCDRGDAGGGQAIHQFDLDGGFDQARLERQARCDVA